MTTQYHSGAWSVNGRILPGERVCAKKIDQILADGTVIQTGEDQIYSAQELKNVVKQLLPKAKDCPDGCLFLGAHAIMDRPISFFLRNITHLGGDWASYKKRIQVGRNFIPFFQKDKGQGVIPILLGCYHYRPQEGKEVRLFVCFSPETFACRKANNSAAHVHTIDLLNAQKTGYYRRIDVSGNELLAFDEKNFVRYIARLRQGRPFDAFGSDALLLDYFDNFYRTVPRTLKGIECLQRMFKFEYSNRKQPMWEGWYLEFLFQQYLKENPTLLIEWWAKKRRGELDFDLRFPGEEWFYGDMKSDNAALNIQGNLKDNVDALVLTHHGRLWYVTFEFDTQHDCDHNYVTTEWWNRKLGKSNLRSYAKRMKYLIRILHMDIYEISQVTYHYLKTYWPSPTASGSRREKILIPRSCKPYMRIHQSV